MFGLFSRPASKTRPTAPAPRARLSLTALESRDCPSGPGGGPTMGGSAPVITSFDVTYGEQRVVTLSGTVQDTNPAGLHVGFNGAASGTTTTDSAGHFSLTLTATCLGNVSATATDSLNLMSAPASLTLTSQAPVISNFQGTEGAGDYWTFTGTVADESPLNLVVYFGGNPVSLQNQSVTVHSDGSFSFGVQLNGTLTDDGTATAQVTDWWGQLSNLAQYTVTQQ